MILYVLNFEMGFSSGCKQFLGIYDTAEKAKEAQAKHIMKTGYLKDFYIIHEVELNQEVDITIAEW